MINILISADETAWESGERMGMPKSRFLEYSGDMRDAISLAHPESLRVLERVTSMLLYEDGVGGPSADLVRVGYLRDIRVGSQEVTFRFVESGRLSRDVFEQHRLSLQIGNWELNRTHWAVKDGELPQDVVSAIVSIPKKYDVVLSFAGEDRAYVGRVAAYLEKNSVEVFYDEYEEVTLWGKDLVEHLDSVYRKQGRYCVMFISRHYAKKMWPRHERKSALSRALNERIEYVLPVRFDDTDIPGLQPTIGYLDLRKLTPDELGTRVLQKLGRRSRDAP